MPGQVRDWLEVCKKSMRQNKPRKKTFPGMQKDDDPEDSLCKDVLKI
jgi:hypothetical protein